MQRGFVCHCVIICPSPASSSSSSSSPGFAVPLPLDAGSHRLVLSPSTDLMTMPFFFFFFWCPGHSVQSHYGKMKKFCQMCADIFLCHHCEIENPALEPLIKPDHTLKYKLEPHACTHTDSLTLNDWVIYWLRRSLFQHFAAECSGG